MEEIKNQEKDTKEDRSQELLTVQPEADKGIIDKEITFEDLGVCKELWEACEKMGFSNPTKIQRDSIPLALKGNDIIGLAETGSGKTASFGLPILQSLLEKQAPFFGLIMSPTRELCVQISQQLDQLGAGIGLKTSVLVGGLDMISQAISLAKKPHIVVGTPGRVADHLANTKGFTLKGLKFLVFDEADRLLDLDFEKQINQILSVIPKERNTYLYSATMTNKVHKLQRASLVSPVKVEVSHKYQTVSTLVQNYHFLPAKYKETYLVYLLTEFTGRKIIVFNSTCMGTLKTSMMLRNLGFKAVALSGNLNQTQRLGALNKFKQNGGILIATDVANRGLDIPAVDLVINYDIPQNTKDYIHRVGRTARAGRSGRSITFVTQYDVENFQKIEHLINKKLEEYSIDQDNALIFHERVIESIRLANVEIKSMNSKSGILSGKDIDDAEDGQDLFNIATKKRFKGRNFQKKSFARTRKRRK